MNETVAQRIAGPLLLAALIVAARPAAAQNTDNPQTPPPAGPGDTTSSGDSAPNWYSIHGQFTNVTQYHPAFNAPFNGPNSLNPGNTGRETTDATLFTGIRLGEGLEAYANTEVDQGFGLSNTLGLAGFSSGEAYKIGDKDPYVRLPRAFVRYTLDLGGEKQKIDDGANQVATAHTADNVTITAGKFGVPDIFDTNTYAHDPRADFLNWSIIDSGAFDYAADSWGYSYGGAIEWNQSWWSLRGGLFDLSRVPNSRDLTRGFGQFELVTEAEERHEILDQPGKLKLLLYVNRGDMGDYSAALRLAEETGTTPNTALVRRYASRPGGALNFEQQIADDLGIFARASLNDGHEEAYEFTEINRSLAAGLALKGTRWDRPDDTVGFAGVLNGISNEARAYLAAGGIGILIGDGQLPQYGLEKILELYYKVTIVDGVYFTADYQHVEDPAYDAARGPVDIFGYRLHLEF
jgi:high affinity Mn2+ porin